MSIIVCDHIFCEERSGLSPQSSPNLYRQVGKKQVEDLSRADAHRRKKWARPEGTSSVQHVPSGKRFGMELLISTPPGSDSSSSTASRRVSETSRAEASKPRLETAARGGQPGGNDPLGRGDGRCDGHGRGQHSAQTASSGRRPPGQRRDRLPGYASNISVCARGLRRSSRTFQ